MRPFRRQGTHGIRATGHTYPCKLFAHRRGNDAKLCGGRLRALGVSVQQVCPCGGAEVLHVLGGGRMAQLCILRSAVDEEDIHAARGFLAALGKLDHNVMRRVPAHEHSSALQQ